MKSQIVSIKDDTIRIRVKVIPGAKGDQIAGILGNRLKIRVSAPPEGGKANKAICRIIAEKLKIRPNQVNIATGQTSPEKEIAITGSTIEHITSTLLNNEQ